MSPPEIAMLAFVLFSVGLFVGLYVRWRHTMKSVIKAESSAEAQREAAHALANETTKLKQATREISGAPNPLEELLSRLRARHGEPVQHR